MCFHVFDSIAFTFVSQVPLIPEITPTARSYTFRNVGDGLLFATQFTQVSSRRLCVFVCAGVFVIANSAFPQVPIVTVATVDRDLKNLPLLTLLSTDCARFAGEGCLRRHEAPRSRV